MSTKSTLKKDYKSEIQERSEEELLEEKIRNQQTLDSFDKARIPLNVTIFIPDAQNIYCSNHEFWSWF